ncbi:hypothetical protein [Bradyrhizobium sp. CCBAU 51765]|uniref:hypothetical protein n=1 Tax=Bradyrhizobium sp. CCBAU 51765 TaxID=1325102 RepID=UPI001886C951|nr:hypothetical protein [Bradyrhizobium sp. CCBAU 51765]QOZ09545.1 hypothetical protein XH96_19905 [Bradyrhizobium sp. CCBAU 51765]
MTRRRSTAERLQELERLVDSATQRGLICEAMLAMSLGMLLRHVSTDLRSEMLRELRACTYFDATGPCQRQAENSVLEAEEKFDLLLDTIEHIARAPQQ